jgi:hypothetical protein
MSCNRLDTRIFVAFFFPFLSGGAGFGHQFGGGRLCVQAVKGGYKQSTATLDVRLIFYHELLTRILYSTLSMIMT